jgi:hypothetical protein
MVNNAAQTVRRPPGFYAHLMHNEAKALNELPEKVQKLMMRYQICTNQLNSFARPTLESGSALPVTWHGKRPGIGLIESARLSQIPYAYDNSLPTDTVFPKGELDVDLQQVDLRTTNSWRLKLGEIQTAEMLEIQLINAVAPFVLCNKLAPLTINIRLEENAGGRSSSSWIPKKRAGALKPLAASTSWHKNEEGLISVAVRSSLYKISPRHFGE